jgi:hypothetical protein
MASNGGPCLPWRGFFQLPLCGAWRSMESKVVRSWAVFPGWIALKSRSPFGRSSRSSFCLDFSCFVGVYATRKATSHDGTVSGNPVSPAPPAFPRKCVDSAVLQGPPTRHEADAPLLANPEGKTASESLVSGIKVTASEYTRVRDALAQVGARANRLPRLQESVFDY